MLPYQPAACIKRIFQLARFKNGVFPVKAVLEQQFMADLAVLKMIRDGAYVLQPIQTVDKSPLRARPNDNKKVEIRLDKIRRQSDMTHAKQKGPNPCMREVEP